MKSHTPVVSQSRAAGTALPLPFLPHLTSPLAGKTEKLHQAHTRLQFPRRRALAKSACVDFPDSIRQRLLSVHMVGAAAVVPAGLVSLRAERPGIGAVSRDCGNRAIKCTSSQKMVLSIADTVLEGKT